MPVTPPPALTDPYAVFAKARTVWKSAHYPDLVAYTVAIRVSEAGTEKTNHYHLSYDALRDAVHVDPVSDEERAHPHTVPPGPSIHLFMLPVGKPEPRTDYLGVPRLTPNYSFGIQKYVPQGKLSGMELVRRIREEFHDPGPVATQPPKDGSLREIASVEAVRRDYTMTIAGMDTIAGHSDYHLQLHPVRDPHRYRLRDVWINAATYFTDRVATDGNFVSGPGPGVKWTIDFAQIGGAPYIAQERAESPLYYRGAIYQQASLSFENVRPIPRSPAWGGISSVNGDILEEP